MPVTYFSHAGILLRPVEKSDLGAVRELRNDESTWVNLTDPAPLYEGGQEAWLQSLGLRSGKFYFVAFDQRNPFIGMVRMDEYDSLNRSIRVGADVASGLRGKGHGTVIYKAIKKYCFDILGCHRVWLEVLETNEVARHLYSQAGFKYEGMLREAVFRDGRYLSYHVMSILEDEYRNLKS